MSTEERAIVLKALGHLRRTTVAYPVWKRRKRAGTYAHPELTEWGQALGLLEPLTAGPKPPPEPQPSPLAALAQNVMFTAWEPDRGLRAPAKWKIAITADRGVISDSLAKEAAARAHAAGHLVAAWGNQEQIGADRIKDLGVLIAADYLIFQAETAAEYDSAIAAGARVIVGNPNAWRSEQRTDATVRVGQGDLAVIFEVYTNEGGPWPTEASAQGVPAASLCLGVGWGAIPYPLDIYKLHTPPPVWPTISIYLAEPLTDTSWDLLP